MAEEKAPPTGHTETDKEMDKLVNNPDFGSMQNTSGTTTAEPSTSGTTTAEPSTSGTTTAEPKGD